MSRHAQVAYLDKEAPEQPVLPQPVPNLEVKEESVGFQLQPQRGILDDDLLEHPDEREELQDRTRVVWMVPVLQRRVSSVVLYSILVAW